MPVFSVASSTLHLFDSRPKRGQSPFYVAFRSGEHGVPLLDGAAAVFECFNRSRYEEGDHVIFVGEVERCALQEGAQPLIFHGGRYFTELPV